LDEPLDDGIRRIATEQADQALGNLRGEEEDLNEAVHDARKRFKKIRAVLRLVRKEMGEEHFKRENRCFRDAGRALAEVRDDWVLTETLDDLRARHEDELSPRAFENLRTRLRERYDATARQVLVGGARLEEVAVKVAAGRQRIQDWPLDPGFQALLPGLGKVYRRGRKRMEDAFEDRTFEAYHEWRKRVKYLWYHARVLRHARWEVMDGWADSVHDLSNLIGEANDLSELRIALGEDPNLEPEGSERDRLLALVDRRREELRESTRPLGQRIYREKPGEFVARVRDSWEAAGGCA
jgi:CHAD domain-containing protein